MQQVQTLGRQVSGTKTKYFMDAYKKATSYPWGYLLINLDLHPKTTDEQYQLTTRILPVKTPIVYLPRE